MIIFKIILLVVGFLGAITFFSNGVVALINVENKEKEGLHSNKILIISGITNFLVIIIFALAVIEKICEESPKEEQSKYQLIQEPLYRQIK